MLLVILLVFANTASAAFMGTRPVSRLANDSEAIVVGSAQATIAGDLATVTIQVGRVIKGPPSNGTISAVWRKQRTGGFRQDGTHNAHGIFFLTRTTNGTWSFLPVYDGAMAFEDVYIKTPLEIPQSARATVQASLPSNPTVTDQVLAELVLKLETTSSLIYDLVTTFRDTPSPVLLSTFNRIRSHQNPVLRAIGLQGLLATGDPSALVFVHQNYSTLSSSNSWRRITDEIKSYYVNTSPPAIQALGQMAVDAKSGDDLRMAATAALSRIHTQQTLPYLARLLDDLNPGIQAVACGGMGSFANNTPIGSHQPAAGDWPYRTQETIAHAGYSAGNVGFWKAWWGQQKNALSR